MKEPNDSARLLLKNAATETAKISRLLLDVSAMWQQATEHLIAGNLIEADRVRMAAFAKIDEMKKPAKSSGDLIRAVRLVDPTFWEENLRVSEADRDERIAQLAREVISRLTLSQAKVELAMHNLLCDNRGCPVEKALEARIAELESQ